ncbi:MAG TPA: hypothetical protein VED02_03355, partial [Methyloceanibacter sp.]|nr:hypothetical protein [Methyloceanibacter sp.]
PSIAGRSAVTLDDLFFERLAGTRLAWRGIMLRARIPASGQIVSRKRARQTAECLRLSLHERGNRRQSFACGGLSVSMSFRCR